MSNQVTEQTVNWRFLLSILLFLGLASGSTRLHVTDDASAAILPSDDNWKRAYGSYLEEYPGDIALLVVVRQSVCSEEGWELLVHLQESLTELSQTRVVVSIASPLMKMVVGDKDSIAFDGFADLTFVNAAQRCEIAAQYEPFSGLVSKDGRSHLLMVFTDPGLDAVTVTNKLKEAVEPFRIRAQELGILIEVTGEPAMSTEVTRLVEEDSRLIALTFFVMLLLLYVFTKSQYAVLAALLLNTFVVAGTCGVMGWLNLSITPATTLAVFLLIPISSAFVIHAHAYQSRLQKDAVKVARTAFFFAGLSTCIGFAATGMTPAEDIQNLALMGVIGIVLSVIGVFLVVFPILSFGQGKHEVREGKVPYRLLGNPIVGYVFLIGLIAYSTTGLLSLRFNYDPMNAVPQDNPVRKAFDKVSSDFGGMSVPLIVNLDRIDLVERWERVSALVSDLRVKFGEQVRVQWLYPHVEQVSEAFTRSNEIVDLTPLSDQGLAQTLLFFEPELLDLYVSDDGSDVQLLIQIPFSGSERYLELKREILSSMKEHMLDGSVTGRVAAFFEAGHRVGLDTIRGLLISSCFLFIVLWILFRSLALALAGILVNIFPVAAGLATLGHFAIPVEMGSSIVAAIAFGILLDDSMHLLVRVQNFVAQGYDPSTSVFRAVGDLFRPIAATSLAIGFGFSILFFAELKTFADFALVILVTLVTALLADLLVLPLLVRRFYRDPVG